MKVIVFADRSDHELNNFNTDMTLLNTFKIKIIKENEAQGLKKSTCHNNQESLAADSKDVFFLEGCNCYDEGQA